MCLLCAVHSAAGRGARNAINVPVPGARTRTCEWDCVKESVFRPAGGGMVLLSVCVIVAIVGRN